MWMFTENLFQQIGMFEMFCNKNIGKRKKPNRVIQMEYLIFQINSKEDKRRKRKGKQDEQKTNNQMAILKTALSRIILNVNELNISIKDRHFWAG